MRNSSSQWLDLYKLLENILKADLGWNKITAKLAELFKASVISPDDFKVKLEEFKRDVKKAYNQLYTRRQ